MDASLPAQRNLIERIVDLPPELRRLTFLYILPTTLRVHYYYYFSTPKGTPPQPTSYRVLPVRLTSVDACSTEFQDYVFRFSDHMIIRGWYQAVTEHLNTFTLWDLGDVKEVDSYLRDPRYRYVEHWPTLRTPFLHRLHAVQHTSISLRQRCAVNTSSQTYDKDMSLLLRLPEITGGHLTLSTVRLYRDHIFELLGEPPCFLADAVAQSAGMLNHVLKGFRKPILIKIACSEAAFNSRSGQDFTNQIRQRCGFDAVRWVSTVTCRYGGRLGDLTVTWKRESKC